MRKSKIGIILILTGICMALISFFASSYYAPGVGLIYNIHNMRLIIDDGHYEAPRWKYVTADVFPLIYNVPKYPQDKSVSGTAWDLFVEDGLGMKFEEYKKKTGRGGRETWLAVFIKDRFFTDDSIEDIEKAIVSNKPIKLADKIWTPALEVSYSSILIFCIIMIFIGIGISALSSKKHRHNV